MINRREFLVNSIAIGAIPIIGRLLDPVAKIVPATEQDLKELPPVESLTVLEKIKGLDCNVTVGHPPTWYWNGTFRSPEGAPIWVHASILMPNRAAADKLAMFLSPGKALGVSEKSKQEQMKEMNNVSLPI